MLAQGFCELGKAEKIWVITHPFSAIKAKKISQKALEITDSVSLTKDWLKTNSGGRKDAFRHGIWMCLLSSRIGPKRALWLGRAHEKKNFKDFKKGKLEDGEIPDSVAVEMDLYNNLIGINLGKNKNRTTDELILMVLNGILDGKFKVVKMDHLGNSLDYEGNVISKKNWEGIWLNDRVLVFSDL